MPTIAPLDLPGHCVTVAFLGDIPFFALAEGTVHRLDHGHKVSELHDGLLCAAMDERSKSLLTGGEDGKVMRLSATAESECLADLNGKWVHCVATGPNDATAWAIGRTMFVRQRNGTIAEFAESRTVEGLAFAPKGLRVAVARYNGVSLHWAGTNAPPVDLEWKGAHFGVTISPNGEHVVSAMVENALHGWRLKDGGHMRMTGYSAKVKSMSWSVRGKWLATSGAPSAVLWPFGGKDGPTGKPPIELGKRNDTSVTTVACHPTDHVVAIGYADGVVQMSRFSDQRDVMLRREGKGAISSLHWSPSGVQLAFGTDAGDCGVIDLSG